MTSPRTHVLSLIPIAILTIALGYHPAYLITLVAGVLLPEVDTISPKIHRSWIFHAFLPTAILYQIIYQSGFESRLPTAVVVVHFITVGMAWHFLFDYVYPKSQSNDGAEWPVRPTVFSEPWGLFWFGLSWLVQWFSYLSSAFLPWLFTQFSTYS